MDPVTLGMAKADAAKKIAAVAKRNGTASLNKSANLDARVPQFVKSPNNPLLTNAAQQPITGLTSIYFPCCFDSAQCGPIGAPNRYLLYFSTDHDANQGGIALAHSASPDKDFTVMPGVRYVDVGFQGAAVTGLAASAVNDTITHNAHGMVAGQGIRFTDIAGVTGIVAGTTYYLRDVTTNSYKLSPFRTSGGPVDITADGTVSVNKVASQTETPSVVWDERGVLTAGTALSAVAATDRITHVGHSMVEGRSVRITARSAVNGLELATTYYVRNVTANSYQLSLIRGGAIVDITADTTVTMAWYGLINLYYQVDGAGTPPTGNTYKQSTCLAVSPDGVTFTRIGVVLDTCFGIGIPDNTNPGDKHTGYFKPFRIGDAWAGYSLYGGGDIPNFAIWYSNDGRIWYPDMRLLTAGTTDVTGVVDRRVEWNSMNVFVYRGKLLALFATKSAASGGNAGITENFIAEIAPDFRSFLNVPAATFLEKQTIETEVNEPDCVMVSEGKLYAYYRINGLTGALCVAVAEG